jgi:hypothetical protein
VLISNLFSSIKNKALQYVLSSRIISFLVQPAIIFLISKKFNSAEQGYYYTIGSLVTISIFFELGLGVVLTNYASHLFSKLKWSEERKLIGEVSDLAFFFQFFRKSVFYYLVVFLLYSICLLVYAYFNFYNKLDFHYSRELILVVVFSGLNLLHIPFMSIIEGCGKIKEVQFIRFLQAIGGQVLICFALLVNFKMEAIFLEYLLYFTSFTIWLLWTFRNLFSQFLEFRGSGKLENFKWKKEILPFQFQVSLSWLSAYFLGYLFVPIAYSFMGPVIAGQLGMTIKITTYIFNVSIAWVNVQSPKYAQLITLGKRIYLNKIVDKTMRDSMSVAIALALFMIFGIYILSLMNSEFSDRVLPLVLFSAIACTNIVNVYNHNVSSYLRAFRREPLLYLNIVVSLLILFNNISSGYNKSIHQMAVGYFLVMLLISFPIGTYLYNTWRKNKANILV